MLRSLDNFWLSSVDKVTTGTYNFVFLIVEIILLALASSLILFSLPATDKTQYFARLSFNSTLQIIHGISYDLQELLKYFNGTTIVALHKIPLAALGEGRAAAFPNNLALYLKDLKLSSLAISALKLLASSLE